MGFGPGIPSRTTPWYIQELFSSGAYPNQPLKPLELQLAPALQLHQHLLNLWYLWHFPLIVPEPMMLRLSENHQKVPLLPIKNPLPSNQESGPTATCHDPAHL